MYLSNLELLRLQADALFTHDPGGRIRWTNEPGETPAPRFFLGRTREGNLWRFRYDVPPDVVHGLESLLAAEPVTDDLRREPVHLEAYRALLREHAPIPGEESGPAYYFPPEIDAPGSAILITPANVNHVLPGMHTPDDDPFGIKNGLDAGSPCAVVVQGGRAVSICFCSRITAHACEAGVETLPPFRGRGYASAVVARWALAVRALGRIPLYSTSWDNIASQGVARRLGLIPYASDLSLG